MVEKKKNTFLRNGIILIVTFLLGMLFLYGIFYLFPNVIGETITKVERDVTVTDEGIADAVDKVYDAVVVVNTYVNGEAYSSGTGFVYKTEDKTAYLLTNNHVIENADDVYVTFTDGTIVEANIVGADVYSDVAVLSVDEDYIISIAEIGSSEDARLGDTVFAIGAPLDSAYSWSVTRGIVSGKDRLVQVELTSGNTKTPMIVNTIQTDAAINSGNSGGPLANSNGEVIGITSIKLASSSIEGMGFAIPIETAIEYAEQLISGNEVERPYLGIYMLDVTSAYYYREYYDIIREANVTSGVIVTDFEDNSPAAAAGLEIRDIITKVDGHDISSSAYLRYYLYKHNVGDEMTLTILRNGRERDINVMLTAS
ncbi:MAG TPA: trypsin-like peptidase domain-containing protein [Candidatus Caccenecus avistercoris]|nr:trypsin-like peptidase domain-containing protein [Candidatus Caccenecus avistercoris]